MLYFVPAKPKKNPDARWLPGVYLGRALNADEYYLGTGQGGVVRSRSVSRVAEEARWVAELVPGVTGTPGRPNEKHADQQRRRGIERSPSPHRREELELGNEHTGGHEPREPTREEAMPAEEEDEDDAGKRCLKLCEPDFLTYKFTPGCPTCAAYQGKGIVRKSNHSKRCRHRVYEAMREQTEPKLMRALSTAEGRERLQWKPKEATIPQTGPSEPEKQTDKDTDSDSPSSSSDSDQELKSIEPSKGPEVVLGG